MMEYRKNIPLSHETNYWFVELGPVPGEPEWHQKLYAFQSYPFPSLEAARRFALGSRERFPSRELAIRFPNGDREGVEVV